MQSNISKPTSSTKNTISRVSLGGIKPFSQQPSSGHFSTSTEDKDNTATELFSRFTADIIKKNVPFTR